MSEEFITLELARIYENQGYFQDALDIYQALSRENGHNDVLEIKAGLQRMESALENHSMQLEKAQVEDPAEPLHEKGTPSLFEQWFALLMLQKRVDLMKQVSFHL